MRATDADNARLIDLAKDLLEVIRALRRRRDTIAYHITALETNRERTKFDRTAYTYKSELWTLQQQLYTTRLEIRTGERELWLAVCVLQRRLLETRSDVLRLIGFDSTRDTLCL